MEFNKTEIDLCKQVAEKHRKEIREGDWVVHVNSGHPTLVRDKESIPYLNNEFQLPLWTISDCLEFLREKGWRSYLFAFDKEGKVGELSIVYFPFKFTSLHQMLQKGNTLLEACLKAILEILNA